MTAREDRTLTDGGRPAATLSRAHAAAVLRMGVSVKPDEAAGEPEGAREGWERRLIATNAPFAGDSRRAAAVGGITVAMLVAAGIGIPDSGQVAPVGSAAAGSVEGRPGSTAVRSAIAASDQRRQEQDPMKSPAVRAAVMAGVVMVASSAGAQQLPAVQWRVEDGGNGHWYAIDFEFNTTYDSKIALAESRGGYLGCIADATENSYVQQLMGSAGIGCRLVLGGRRQCDACPWGWVSDEPWPYLNWGQGEPGNGGAIHIEMFPGSGQWADVNDYDGSCVHYLIEWSADCNSDGIVDYGQILAGDLADANSNGIPDVCEVPSCIDADLNPNGIVDGADLGALLAFWGPVSPAFPRADINGDGNVNGADLGILLSLWGPCGG